MESVLMMKQMDLDEWELLDDDDHDDGGNKIKIYSSKYDDDDDSVLEMNYFICPPKHSSSILQPKITLNPNDHDHDNDDDDDDEMIPPVEVEVAVGDQEQVLLKKLNTPIGEFDSSSGGKGKGNGNNVWKRGMGAIWSFGITAAATFCIVVLNHNNKTTPNQNIRFQIYSTHKVIQQASKLNEAIRGGGGGVQVPISKARITCGGYYDPSPSPSPSPSLSN